MTPEELYEKLRPLQEAKGYFFNKDKAFVLDLMESLLINRDRYGYMAAVLEQSILRGWEGLFALKDDFVDAVPTQRPASTEDRPREIGPDTDILDFL